MKQRIRDFFETNSTYSDSDSLKQLSEWYLKQCDGFWEHSSGVEISTLDNPGWSIQIDLNGTALENKTFLKIEVLSDERDWLVCEVLNKMFYASCGPLILPTAIGVFLQWATSDVVE